MVIVLSVVCIILGVLILMLNRENSRLRALYEKSNEVVVYTCKAYSRLSGSFTEVEHRIGRNHKVIPGFKHAQLELFIKDYDKLVAKHKRASKHCERMAKQIQVFEGSLDSLCAIHNESVDYYLSATKLYHNKCRSLSYHENMYKNKWQRATVYLRIFAEYIKYLHKRYEEIDFRYYKKSRPRKLLNLEEFVVELQRADRL